MTNTHAACSDELLRRILRADEDSHEYRAALGHLEECATCRTRLEQLAATEEVWREAQLVLSAETGTEPGAAHASDSTGRRARWNRRPTVWTESMARQLLSPPSHPELLGQLGRYEVERLIGSGGMGVVFKAFDTDLHRPVAVKVLAPYLAGSGAARSRFAREARAAAAIVHEHVVAIHNVETDGAAPFLVMQFVGGESLQQRLDRLGPLELCELLRIALQTAAGLAAAHAQGLVHRDVKPSNILLEHGVDRALLTDFGLARASDDASLTQTGHHPGTPQFMSPEQARGEAVDARTDLFSLGSVIYTMCTGRPPFRAETSYGVLRRITDEEPRPIREINPSVPVWLCAIVGKLMSKQPDERFASASQVAELLKDCLAHVQQPTMVSLPATVERLAQWHVRQMGPQRPHRGAGGLPRRRWLVTRRWLVGLAVGIGLLYAAFLVVLELNQGQLLIESEVDDVSVRIVQGGEDVDRLSVTRRGTTVRLAAGNYVVTLDGEADGLMINDGAVTLQRGGRDIVRIVRTRSSSAPGPPEESDHASRRPSTSGGGPAAMVGTRWQELWALDDNGGNLRRIADCGEFTQINSPEVSPDGKFVAVDGWRAEQNLRDARVLIIDVATGETTNLCQGAMPTWSPDGKWISFCKYGRERGVYIRALDGGSERLLDRDGWGIQWSPDGLKAAYSRGGKLVVHNFVSDTERVIQPADWDYTYIYWNPAWSPDAKQICFKARRRGGPDEFAIVTIDADPPTVSRRINAQDFNEDIAWHPHGSRILIPRRAIVGQRGQICEFAPNGTDEPRVVAGQPQDRHQGGMCWTRDGRTLYFISQRAAEPADMKSDSTSGYRTGAASTNAPATQVSTAIEGPSPNTAWHGAFEALESFQQDLMPFELQSQQPWDHDSSSKQE